MFPSAKEREKYLKIRSKKKLIRQRVKNNKDPDNNDDGRRIIINTVKY